MHYNNLSAVLISRFQLLSGRAAPEIHHFLKKLEALGNSAPFVQSARKWGCAMKGSHPEMGDFTRRGPSTTNVEHDGFGTTTLSAITGRSGFEKLSLEINMRRRALY